MSQVVDDLSLVRTPLRKALFPFFDTVEIGLVLTILLLEFLILPVLYIENWWVIPFGSYFGMLGVGWITLPSTMTVESGEDLILARSKLINMGMVEISSDTFVPNLPSLLRWQRNKVLLRSRGILTIRGPRVILLSLQAELNR